LAAKLGMIDDAYAHDTVLHICDVVSKLDTASGLLPHFVAIGADGKYAIMPGTEYSVIDTSIYYHSMLLAAQMLGDKGLLERVTKGVRDVALGPLMDASGYVRQGLRADKVTPLPAVWRDWGGETALILAMAAMTQRPPVIGMDNSGK